MGSQAGSLGRVTGAPDVAGPRRFTAWLHDIYGDLHVASKPLPNTQKARQLIEADRVALARGTQWENKPTRQHGCGQARPGDWGLQPMCGF